MKLYIANTKNVQKTHHCLIMSKNLLVLCGYEEVGLTSVIDDIKTLRMSFQKLQMYSYVCMCKSTDSTLEKVGMGDN